MLFFHIRYLFSNKTIIINLYLSEFNNNNSIYRIIVKNDSLNGIFFLNYWYWFLTISVKIIIFIKKTIKSNFKYNNI